VTAAVVQTRKLTARQMQVFNLMAGGLTDQEVGKMLFITEDSVYTHVHRAIKALGARNRPHAVYIAMRRGIIR
jgi:DNA-binding CsgD family transcriptional regulator